MIVHSSYAHNSEAVVRLEPEKSSDLNNIRIPVLCRATFDDPEGR